MADHFYGVSFVLVCSPPFTAHDIPTDSFNVFRSCEGDAAGDPTAFTDWADGGVTLEGAFNPVLSPDSTKIVYTQMNVATGLGELWVVNNSPGSTPTAVLTSATEWLNTPMWHPDSDRIVYTRGASGGDFYGGTIETLLISVGTPSVLYTPTGSQRAYRPSYNFDGSRIAFMLDTTGGSGTHDLIVMDDDGSNVNVVDGSCTYRLDGSQWSWANTQDVLAYENGRTGGAIACKVVNGDGTGSTKISVGDLDLTSMRMGKFAWPSDDSFVEIASNQGDGYYASYRAETNGSGSTRLQFTHGSANQAFMRQHMIYNSRIWFIEVASGTSGGTIGSTALDGSDYVESLDVNDAAIINDFSSGEGFEYQ